MSDAKKIWGNGNLLAFAGGAAAVLLAPKFLKSACVRKTAVCAVAKGMQLQNDVIGAFSEICEDAQDIYHEAKEQAKGRTEDGIVRGEAEGKEA
ncbi:MAG: DUF1490 domain-containing protein [Clostridiales Family XIII bacterium]|nr:DUF1490 domain-containing protein [Clostridiales Family XIII bacterium]